MKLDKSDKIFISQLCILFIVICVAIWSTKQAHKNYNNIKEDGLDNCSCQNED